MLSGRSGPPARRDGQRGPPAGIPRMQPFSAGVSKSERVLMAGTDGSVEQVEANIAQAVRQFGPAPGGKKMMDAERAAAEEAISTGLYGIWRNASCGHDFCGRVGPQSRCFCGHDYGEHAWDRQRRALRPKCGACACGGFRYIPRRPEEVGEWWLPRRRGFDVRIWRAKCKCQHGHEEHDPNHLSCRLCGCHTFQSAWLCVVCEGKWEDHETLWESEEERRLQGLAVGQAFLPLASTPEIQGMFDAASSGAAALGDAPRSHSLPHRPRPERSVRLMRERCPNYGGPGIGASALGAAPAAAGSLEDAFPPRGAAAGSGRPSGGLEDAFPPRNGGGGMVAGGGWPSGGLEDAFPPRSDA